MAAVVIGMDPHKRSATIEVMAGDETVLGGGRYASDAAGYRAMVKYAKQLSVAQAKALLASVRPRDVAGKTRRRVAAELVADLQRNKGRRKSADRELKQLLAESGTTLMDLDGIGPSNAARLLVEVGDITR